jgi:ACR3 family arsenite efflux pump ArsB
VTTKEHGSWRWAALAVIAVQTAALAVYWYVGAHPVRTHFDRVVDDVGLYFGAPLFAALVALGVLVAVQNANRGVRRYLALLTTVASAVTVAVASLLSAVVFLAGPI